MAPFSSAVWKMDLVKRYPGARDREVGSAVRERMGWIRRAAFSDEVRVTQVVPRWLCLVSSLPCIWDSGKRLG